MNEREFISLCKKTVAEYANAHLDKADHKQITEIDIKNYFLNTNIDNAVVVGHDGSVHVIKNLSSAISGEYIDILWDQLYNDYISRFPKKEIAEHNALDVIYESGLFDYESS